ncbi:MAG: hypothetical protein B7Y98_00300 [Sphingomonas sp. 32-62-10]|nr:MAG: hypothetical protein B7Z43_05505 [Sphingomonas sp. 12-62-6]OYX40765.1 MAG: hypothetical protein B7Y98_00300 [Sphingomonas sp. 32-62-10]
MALRITGWNRLQESSEMTILSKAALAAALLIGTTGVILPATADAQKKKDEKAPKAPALSAEFRKAALEAQTQLKAKNVAAAEPAVIASEAAAKNEDEIYYARLFRLQLESDRLEQAAKGDPAVYRRLEIALIKPLDDLIADAKTDPKDRSRFTYRRGLIEYGQKRYAAAVTFFEKARELGEADPELPLSLTKAKIESGDIVGGAAGMKVAIDAELAAGRKPIESWYDYIIPRLAKADKFDEYLVWSQAKLKQYPTAKNWRTLIVYFGFSGKRVDLLDKGQKIDLFRLMRANNALADLADFAQYAQYLNSIGLPVEAKAVFDEGVKSGKMQLTREDDKGIYAASVAAIKLDGPISARETKAKAAATGVAAAAAGDSYLGESNYAKAVELYKIALEKGVTPVKVEEINTRLGIAYALMRDDANARAAFAKVKSSPRNQIAAFWIVWLDLGATTPTA